MTELLDPFGTDGPAVIGPELAALHGIRGSSSDDPSGRRLAEQAHEAGQVAPPVELDRHTCTLEFVARGSARDAGELVDAIAATLAKHPLVDGNVTASVVAR